MNHGKFFSLDLEASHIEKGIVVFDYTDIFDASVDDSELQTTPRYPIFVSISSASVKFILQYCVYKQKDGNFKILPKSDKHTNCGKLKTTSEVRHLEEVLIELPITTTSGYSLAATLKRLYLTPFPIQLKKEKNYILQLIERRYENGNIYDLPYAHKRRYKSKKKTDKFSSNITYSSLPVYKLLKKNGYKLYTLHTIKDKKTREKKYDKVLQKLILDFFFDMMHSDVFKNSMHYDQMYSTFMSDFFCSAIIRKAEYYYQRALVNDLCKDKSISDSIDIYAVNLEKAEKHWLECIQSPEADKHFEFQPNWFEPKVERKSRYKSLKLWWHFCNLVTPSYKIIGSDFWFASPEEELQRVYYREKYSEIACSEHLCSKINGSTLKHPISKDHVLLQQRTSASTKWLLKRYNFRDAYRVAWFPWANSICLFILVSFITLVIGKRNVEGVFSKLYNIFYNIIDSIFQVAVDLFLWLSGKIHALIDYVLLLGIPLPCVVVFLAIIGIYLLSKYFRGGKMNFIFPRLIASITAAWLTISLGEDLYKAFFDIDLNGWSIFFIIFFIWVFVSYEVHRIVPHIKLISKMLRAGELIIISFAISLAVGICVINFTGDRMLVRSGILPRMYRDDVLVKTTVHNNGDPTLMLNFNKIAEDTVTKWNDSIIMNYYTHSPYGHLDSIDASLAVRQFADTPYDDTYMQRIANIYIGKDSLINPITRMNLVDSISLVRGRFLLNHDNSLLFKDLLPYVEHRNNGRSVAKIIPLFEGNYKLFLLHDFLIQFAVIAMFIGVFIQMIFEEKNVTEV